MIDMHMFSVVLSLPVASRFTEAADTADFVNKLKQFDELVRNQLCNQLKQKVSPESVFFFLSWDRGICGPISQDVPCFIDRPQELLEAPESAQEQLKD